MEKRRNFPYQRDQFAEFPRGTIVETRHGQNFPPMSKQNRGSTGDPSQFRGKETSSRDAAKSGNERKTAVKPSKTERWMKLPRAAAPGEQKTGTLLEFHR